MAVTRRGEGDLALRLEMSQRFQPNERRIEARWLLLASLLAACGLAFVFFAKTQDFAHVDDRLRSGELLNVNAAPSPDALTAALANSIASQGTREAAGAQLYGFLQQHRPLPNVGALARVPWVSLGIPRGEVSRLKPVLTVRTPREFTRVFLLWAALYLGVFWAVHFAWRARRFRGDPSILPTLQLLTVLGLILMVSLRDPLRDTLEFRKFTWGVIGGCLLLLLPLFKAFQARNFARWTYTPLFFALLLFGALFVFGSGPTGTDARVNLGPFQPVELIKIALVFFLAGYFAKNWERLRDLRENRFVPGSLRSLDLPQLQHVLPVMVAVACSLVMFFVLKDMGPALVVGMLFLVLFGVARKRPGLALFGIAILVAGVAIGNHFGTPHTVVDRVSMWLSPWNNDVRGGDQLAHSLWAFATGGTWGSGPGWGDPGIIPAGHTDLVLPAIAEEWGLPGVLAIASLFTLLVARSFRIAVRARDEYSVFLSAGLGILLALEMLLISGGVLGAIPLSGVVSPFLSSGNTAMLANFLICAILLGVSNQSTRSGTEFADESAPAAPRFASLFGKPLRISAWIFGLSAAGLLVRAAYLEIFQSSELLAKDALVYTADGVKRPEHNPRLNLLAAMITRGDIYDRNGVLLATSQRTKLEQNRAVYEKLGVSIDQAGSPTASRFYPFGSATIHLLGDLRTGERFHATNASLIEHDSNRTLQGYQDYGDLAAVVRYRHHPHNPQLQALLRRNRDVHSSLDIRLQLKAVEIVGNHLSKLHKKGAAIMLDAASGDVLALVSWPAPSSDEPENDELFDRARYGEYPPGSTFKLVTAMAALRVNPDAANQTFTCRRLSDGRAGTVIPGWRRPIRDDIGDRVHGALQMRQAIAVSCNAYFAQLGVFAVGARSLFETAQALGINAGSERQVKEMLPFAAYGQGPIVATPLQMARVAATIAEDGKMPQGRWVTDDSDGRHAPPQQIISPAAATFLSQAMREVVTGGTARQAMSGLALEVAGKTGTAQLDHGEPHSWFAGFAPYDAPAARRIAVAVIVEHGGYGAKFAAPIARDLLEAATGK